MTGDDPNAMPSDIVDYLSKNHWGHMHLDFHVARMWDRLGGPTQQWARGQGIARWQLQEGQPTTGLEFLAMHRLMIEELRTKFPQHEALFIGWQTPPTDPNDAETPMPGTKEAFDRDMLTAIDRLENRPDEFQSDDDFALFLQTRSRPTESDPFGRTSEPSAGIHNYLHNRFSDDNSEISVGDPSVNLNNRVFWRIHGWVDSQWNAFRKSKGLDNETDELYRKAMADAQTWMEGAMVRSESKADEGGCPEPVPDEVKSIFVE